MIVQMAVQIKSRNNEIKMKLKRFEKEKETGRQTDRRTDGRRGRVKRTWYLGSESERESERKENETIAGIHTMKVKVDNVQ